MSDIYGQFERSRENVWAHKEDQKAIEKLRERLDAEAQMGEKLAWVKQKHTPV